MELRELYVEEINDEYFLTTNETGMTLNEYINNTCSEWYYTPDTLNTFYLKIEVPSSICKQILMDEFNVRFTKDDINIATNKEKTASDMTAEKLHEIAIELLEKEFSYILSNARSIREDWK